MQPDLVLKVSGGLYSGWKSVRINRGIEQIAGTFDLSVTERWSGQDTARPIKPGESCQVLMGGVPVITGYVDDVKISYDSGSHGFSVTGRDKTGDLVDCAAIHKSGQWSGRKVEQIAADLCAPFGIKVIKEVDTGSVLSEFTIQEGESAFECIERAARMRSILLVSDGLGNLVITRAGKTSSGAELVEGKNIKKCDGEFSWKDRFSKYIVKGQAQGNDEDNSEAVTGQKGEASDGNIARYRPLIVIAEDQGHAATFKQRAEWESSVRTGRGNRVSVTVQGWQHAGGLWLPNTLVRLRSPLISIDADFLISACAYTLDDAGTVTDLTLTLPEAFELISEKTKTKKHRASSAYSGDRGLAK